MKKIGLASDHAGFPMKEHVKKVLKEWMPEVELIDFGTHSEDSVDYPDFAHKLGDAIDKGDLQWGVAVCGSANGISMALNKHKNVRAAISWCEEIAELARLHNNANILSLPGRFLSDDEGEAILRKFFTTEFEGGRHQRRVEKI
ncbi:RpiB/LacA/LacB family sugar-phosphate isomerase [Porphyromonadaceae bacterium W3.11]|nr:RpiB/LacA/LacB family sugar-phosphate isomerase [Porphyromonadaceae bacterium W3.11]